LSIEFQHLPKNVLQERRRTIAIEIVEIVTKNANPEMSIKQLEGLVLMRYGMRPKTLMEMLGQLESAGLLEIDREVGTVKPVRPTKERGGPAK